MITSSAEPLFGGQKRQKTSQAAYPMPIPPQDEEIHDVIVVKPLPTVADKDTFSRRSVARDSDAHMRATLPELGDVRHSRSAGDLRKQATLLRESELKEDLEQHTAFKTYNALELLYDFKHPLPADELSRNAEFDRHMALRDLHAKAKKSDAHLRPSSKRYLTSLGLLNQAGKIDETTRSDVKKILKVCPLSQEVSLTLPKRDNPKPF